jgi:acetyl-CoA acetyltransferase
VAKAFICDAIRTPIGRYGGALAGIHADDLAAIPLAALKARNPDIDWAAIDDIVNGCANQASEDNRNVAHTAALLAGLGDSAPGSTVNRLCGSGPEAVGIAARAIKAEWAELMIAGGVESQRRAAAAKPMAALLPKSPLSPSRSKRMIRSSSIATNIRAKPVSRRWPGSSRSCGRTEP